LVSRKEIILKGTDSEYVKMRSIARREEAGANKTPEAQTDT
jgi:hypothetical protein